MDTYTDTLYLDYETYSTQDLRRANPYRYSEDPQFMALMCAYAFDDEPVQVLVGRDAILAELGPSFADPRVRKVAHNAQFERVVSSRLLGMPVGTYLQPEGWDDTMALAGEWGYPLSLDALGRALQGELKDSAGTALINWFCKPDRNGQRRLPEDHPEKWAQFVAYCAQDVETLRSVARKLGDWPTPAERATYLADQRINDRGVAVDVALATAAVAAAEDNRMVQELEISGLTGVVNPGSQPQMLGWLRKSGLRITDLQAATIQACLSGVHGDLTPTQRRVLELRQELALVAAKKYQAVLDGVSADGRLRGQFRFFGAHTGRWSGKGVQLHNMPRAAIGGKEDTAAVKEALTEAAILDLKMGFETDAHTLKALVRPTLVGPFTVVDYSGIEAVTLAWLAGEEWVLEAFRNGEDVYVKQAGKMAEATGGTYGRSDGKVATLALGYQGAVDSLRHLGATGTDKELQLLVDAYRKANAEIAAFWYEMGDAFKNGGPVGAGLITVEVDGDVRLLRLPSGRAIVYRGCKWQWEAGRFGKRMTASFSDPRKNGTRTRTYGGKLTENVTQAVARDLLANALVNFDGRDSQTVVGHIHDELVVEGVGRHSVQSVGSRMNALPKWAKGLPVSGDGYTTARYRKA